MASAVFPEPITLKEIRQLFVAHGTKQLFVKELAKNHDSKRQVYLSTSFEPFNIFPTKIEEPPPLSEGITATKKSLKTEQPRVFGLLDFYWMNTSGELQRAPEAKLIMYPQYPEVRFSGFLRGTSFVPSAYLQEKAGDVFDNRLLFLGITPNGRVIGFLVVGQESLRQELRQQSGYNVDAGYNGIALHEGEDDRSKLLAELLRVHLKGWIDPVRLSRAGLVPCAGRNCAGFTLEAELGIEANSLSDPDFMGWEVKQHGVTQFDRVEVGVITLFTPEPDSGFYVEEGVIKFVKRFGYADVSGIADRMNFGGIHRSGEIHPRTKLVLSIAGYDPSKPGKFDPEGNLSLMSEDGIKAASWSFRKLLEHWNRKHGSAAYVVSRMQTSPQPQYCYGHIVHLGQGTDFSLFLKAVSSGAIYLDPGIKVERCSTTAPVCKRRNQFRIRSGDLSLIYRSWETVDLLTR